MCVLCTGQQSELGKDDEENTTTAAYYTLFTFGNKLQSYPQLKSGDSKTSEDTTSCQLLRQRKGVPSETFHNAVSVQIIHRLNGI